METNNTAQEITATTYIISADALLEHWQGHRRLSRKVIEAFPEDQFYTFSIGGMRTYAELTMEMIGLAAPGIRGIAFGDWTFSEPVLDYSTPAPATKPEVLNLWDLITEYINNVWPQIPPQRFQEVEAAFGMYEDKIVGTVQYLIDNEIHHRAQGYVYLRALGVEPPAFWDRQ
ncbi:DinB family protein [Dyadobacter fermentans]|uniref:DinB family protein n=1 Tax=Dyadobacter fermentans (strain ATCC 700827 / DSM 18053 / CIP 107007 / KCTC 52180 / NS114) TaxID=471854 RepID=C6W626_DYAFD|nr:DinB family protein [Dyadobacter fermentans]ACT92506.1 DinB family protein [Dyadobacter fermentans DSM 18053]